MEVIHFHSGIGMESPTYMTFDKWLDVYLTHVTCIHCSSDAKLGWRDCYIKNNMEHCLLI